MWKKIAVRLFGVVLVILALCLFYRVYDSGIYGQGMSMAVDFYGVEFSAIYALILISAVFYFGIITTINPELKHQTRRRIRN